MSDLEYTEVNSHFNGIDDNIPSLILATYGPEDPDEEWKHPAPDKVADFIEENKLDQRIKEIYKE